jgi:hypothetical protein
VYCPIGAEQTYTVPSGVTSVAVVAVAGEGGSAPGVAGGHGAVVSGVLPVNPGETLYVEVGGNAQPTEAPTFGGGGGANNASDAGGGASDVRTAPSGPGALSLDSRLLVAGGGGGAGYAGMATGGTGGAALINGGAGASGTDFSVNARLGQGGGGATLTGGGTAGAGGPGNGSSGEGGVAGTFGIGGVGGGGGGGGGWYGGGGGGEGGTDTSSDLGGSGGGGAGSSYAAPFVSGVSIATDTTGQPEVTIAPAAPSASASPGSVVFAATQPAGTLSGPASTPVTVSNSGTEPLSVTSLSYTGADPGDFVAYGCPGVVDPGSSCQIDVRFAPQAQGARSATLDIATTDPAHPTLAVSLSGTGGPLPQGPPGQTGAAGPAGEIELVTCKSVKKKVTKTVKHKRKTVTVTEQQCTTKLISGTVKFTAAATARVSLTRGRVTYATGTIAAGRLILTARRRVAAGRYMLIIRYRRDGAATTARERITIT